MRSGLSAGDGAGPTGLRPELATEELARRLAAAASGDPCEALALLVQELPAHGACLVEWSSGSPPSMLGISGLIQDVEADEAFMGVVGRLREGRPRVESCLHPGPPPFHVVAASGGSKQPLLLVVWADFHRRPDYEPLLLSLLDAVDRQRSRPTPAPRAAGPALVFPPAHVPGDSPAIHAMYREMELLLQGDLPVLIVGETGVGKEAAARTLHGSSSRRAGPFVAVNCAAIPADLLEAEMFGIAKGVATGVDQRQGKFQLADGGTLFLDEIGEMLRPLQSKLLRAFDAREIHPVGGAAIPVNVRILCATNMDLLRSVEEGRFRRDLYYRAAGFVLRVPPLRERKGHVPRLVGEFIRVFEREAGKKLHGISVRAMRALAEYRWPGNVRELEHEVRRLVYLCAAGESIDLGMLSAHILVPDGQHGQEEDVDETSLSLADSVARLERRLILAALRRTRGNHSEAARMLGISRNGLAIKMKRLGIGDEKQTT